MTDNSSARSASLVPNFGGAKIALSLIVFAQIIAIILTASRNGSINQVMWGDLLHMTILSQSIAFASIAALRVVANPVRKLSPKVAGTIVFFTLVLVSIGVAETLVYTLFITDRIPTRWPDWHWSLLARTGIIATLVFALVVRYIMVNHRARIEAQQQQQDRLQALQSRIRPHFLFNSMNSIATLIRSDPELAERALQDLADVFRVLLADARKMVPIAMESELARQYLNIEKMRLGDRLQVKWTASNVPRSALIPSLTLQPLIENAVYHGIEPSFAGGTVDIQLWSEQDVLNVMITNPLPEITNQAQHRRGNQIAMNNVRERLESHFGGQAQLENIEQLGMYRVKLRMPIMRG